MQRFWGFYSNSYCRQGGAIVAAGDTGVSVRCRFMCEANWPKPIITHLIRSNPDLQFAHEACLWTGAEIHLRGAIGLVESEHEVRAAHRFDVYDV